MHVQTLTTTVCVFQDQAHKGAGLCGPDRVLTGYAPRNSQRSSQIWTSSKCASLRAFCVTATN